MSKEIQVASLRTAGDEPENAVTLMRNEDDGRGTISIWIQNEDGDASDEFTFDQYTEMDRKIRTLMGW